MKLEPANTGEFLQGTFLSHPGCLHDEEQFALVGPEYLLEAQSSAADSGDLIVLEAHFSSVDHPLDPEMPVFRHIPGAVQIHPSYLEAGLNREKYYPHYDHPEESNIMKGRALTDALEHLGIHPESTIVVYGSDPDGVMAAARLIWGLMYAGVKRVRLLDGGIEAWIGHGQTAEMSITSVWDVITPPRRSSSWSLQEGFLASSESIRQHVANASDSPVGKLIDVRTDGEWNGSTPQKYTFFSRAGHIRGAIHQGDWDNLLDGTSKRLARHLAVVARRWRDQGILDPEVENGKTPLTFYCGTGWRSSIAFLVAHLLGFRSQNYEEGFFGWSHYPEHPVERPSTLD
ncbi:rhodanese-like domain-containing protein [Akkermansiaceae bacterium]|nr:rhodanese-like domain-containing protein [Akkermansiaceae bacterium]MDA7933769.1 rhodanese-like domain-containing protein [Akkermansiaceae bacterium]MDB4423692.1 rhodanese-like domain-containing protein [bacterium]MDB4464732.1 rhodanese-like domain-containing protein [Akkermansiaceae bacterium]